MSAMDTKLHYKRQNCSELQEGNTSRTGNPSAALESLIGLHSTSNTDSSTSNTDSSTSNTDSSTSNTDSSTSIVSSRRFSLKAYKKYQENWPQVLAQQSVGSRVRTTKAVRVVNSPLRHLPK